jgi:hypothetical protein
MRVGIRQSLSVYVLHPPPPFRLGCSMKTMCGPGFHSECDESKAKHMRAVAVARGFTLNARKQLETSLARDHPDRNLKDSDDYFKLDDSDPAGHSPLLPT